MARVAADVGGKGSGGTKREREALERELDRRVEGLGFEVVDLRWAGSSRRPILRLRIDLPDSRPGRGVTVDDCARVSRALEPWLEGLDAVPERYVLEVSSPGIERPLTRRRDWVRFRGETVAVKGRSELAGRSRRLEGVLGALRGDEGRERVELTLPAGEKVEVALDEVEEAHLVYEWS